MLLLMSPVTLGATIPNALDYDPNSPSWVSWYGPNITSSIEFHISSPERPYFVEASPWNVGNTGLQIKFTRMRTSTETLRLSYTYLGCTFDGQPTPDARTANEGYPTGNLISDAKGIDWFLRPNQEQEMGEIRPQTPTGNWSNYFVRVSDLTGATQSLYYTMYPPGEYQQKCGFQFNQNGSRAVTVRTVSNVQVSWGGGSVTRAGFHPNVLDVRADPRTGEFTAKTDLTIPAVATGTLEFTSDKPISIDLGAGASPQATSITTLLTGSGTARGTVKLRGTISNPGMSIYNIRAVSSYM